MKNKKPQKQSKSYVSVSPLTLISVVAVVLLGHGIELLAYSVTLLLHEYAHAFAAERFGYGLRKIKVMPYGISMSLEDGMDPEHEIVIAAAGPAVNIFTWIVLAGIWWLAPTTYAATQPIADASLFTGLINLLPVCPLDGGRILRCALSLKLRPSTVVKIMRAVGMAFGVCGVAACITLMVLGANFTYATIGMFVIVSLAIPGDGRYERLYARAATGKRLGRGLKVRELMVDKDLTLFELYKMLRPDCYTKFVITDISMKPLASMTESELDIAVTQFNASETAISVAKRNLI